MIAKASSKFVRISPRKVRYVIDMIREKNVLAAQAILNGSPRRAGGLLQKLLSQAVDAAKRNSQIDVKDLFVSLVTADGGPTMKRFRPMSMGRAGVIRKRTSHIHLELDVRNKNVVKAAPNKPLKANRAVTAPVSKKESGKKKLVGAK